MPEIGAPLESNQFRKIQMKKPANAKVEGSFDKNSQGVKFVDRKKHNNIGKNEFLKLLTYQLQNQDPLNPMDQKKFAADLAQFSQLEQLANMNSMMEKQDSMAPSQKKFYAASFLGKKAVTSGQSVSFNGKKDNVEIPFYLDRPAKSVMIRVLDNKGQIVRQIEEGARGRGPHMVSWDTLAMDGQKAAAGDYRINVFGVDENFARFKAEAKSSGLVKSVDFEGDEAILTLDSGRKVSLKDIESFVAESSSKQIAPTTKTVSNAYKKVGSTQQ